MVAVFVRYFSVLYVAVQDSCRICRDTDRSDLLAFSDQFYSCFVRIKRYIADRKITYFLCSCSTCIHKTQQGTVSFAYCSFSIRKSKQKFDFLLGKKASFCGLRLFQRYFHTACTKYGSCFIFLLISST